MKVRFTKEAKRELRELQRSHARKDLDKIKELLNSIIDYGPLKGIGKPEVLRYYDPTAYSRKITKKDRLVYRIINDEIIVLSCKGHYQEWIYVQTMNNYFD